MNKRSLILFAAILLAAACSTFPVAPRQLGEADGVPLYKMTVERLPDLPKPRGGQHTMLLGDELTVLGGITDGFVLEPTIAYLRDGAWHQVPMKYPHHYGFTTLLQDGSVMLGGGCSENFGIGQSWGVETYNPSTHTCKAVGIMDRKRAGVSASVLQDGRVVISGNWYADDAIGLYEPGDGFSFVKEPAVQRAYPQILPISPDNALIFSSEDTHGNFMQDLVDQLSGEPFTEPLLKEWNILPYMVNPTSADDLRTGEYAYLLPASRQEDGQAGLLRLTDGHFSLLETERPLPMALPDDDPLVWMHSLQVDRASRSAWMYALSGNGRFVAARIGYDPIFEGGKATLEMFLADKPGGGSFFKNTPRLLEGGRIVLAGGVLSGARDDSNFETTGEVWLFHTVAPVKKAVPLWWILPILLLAAFAGGWAVTRVRKRPLPEDVPDPAKMENNDLQTRITDLVEEKQLFLIKDLKITDIARELGTNVTYISACINGQMGISFPEFISRYRVEYALKLMQEHPEMSSVEVWDASGFNNEKTFFRRFRLQTGMTPSEWKKQHLTK